MDHVADAPGGDRNNARHRGGIHCVSRILSRAPPSAAGLSGNRGGGGLGIAPGSGCRLRAIATGATVDIADFDAALIAYGHIEEIEQVTTNICAAAGPNTAALHRGIWRRIGGGPM